MRLLTFPLAIALFSSGAGCGSPQVRPRNEDQSRKVAPLPACVLKLPARRVASVGTRRKLTEEQVVKLLFPAFDEKEKSLPRDTTTCTGAPAFEGPAFRDAKLVRRSGWPLVTREGDLTYGSGGDGLKLVWVRTHTLPDQSAAGPLAVIRSGERFAELFAIGSYRGAPDRVALSTVRMGGEYLVTVTDDGCTGHKSGTACQTSMTVLLPRMGKLAPLVEVPLERIAYSGRSERGSMGVLEYRLSSVPEFRDGGVKIVEQVRVKDDTGRDLRKAEHERLVTFDDTGAPKTNEPSLWDQMVAPETTPAPRSSKP